jgi:hypothetical protein
VWNRADGLTVPEGATVFRLKFSVLEGGLKLSEVLTMPDKVLPALAFNSQLASTRMALVYTEAAVTGVAEATAAQAELLQNRPNPFVGRTTIGFVLPEAGEAMLRVLDGAGRELVRVRKHYPAGYSEEVLDLDATAPTGLLYYELVTSQGKQVRRMTALGR